MAREQTAFEWKPDYTSVLEGIAANDAVSALEWDLVRHMIKHKINQSIEDYLGDPSHVPTTPPSFAPESLPSGWLRLPPFPKRQTNTHVPVSFMNKEQAEEMKGFVFEQLDEFESFPFTIQRVCELCLSEKKYYATLGKYLRAMEKALLVTSTWESFPPLTDKEKEAYAGASIASGSTPLSVPSTPMFSPIPFMHEDARRSASRSPPPPLSLGAPVDLKTDKVDLLSKAHETAALGLVDELDHPGPGHMSEHPTALTSTTSSTSPTTETPPTPSLAERFTPATPTAEETPTTTTSSETPESTTNDTPAADAMDVDEDKENKSS